MGIREENPELVRIAELAHNGQKIKAIKAIKAYRELTGDGLKEAKDAVERLAPRE
ncbi:ribosomal protein L7/L12 [Streptomyces olivoreticuli]